MEARVKSVGLQQIEAVKAQAAERTCVAWRAFSGFAAKGVSRGWRFLMAHARSKPKTLFVQETATLGDRRFVSVIQFEGQRFLVGSSPSSVALLAQLPVASGCARRSGNENDAYEKSERD
jgi:flagellar biogenesis protein FliO